MKIHTAQSMNIAHRLYDNEDTARSENLKMCCVSFQTLFLQPETYYYYLPKAGVGDPPTHAPSNNLPA